MSAHRTTLAVLALALPASAAAFEMTILDDPDAERPIIIDLDTGHQAPEGADDDLDRQFSAPDATPAARTAGPVTHRIGGGIRRDSLRFRISDGGPDTLSELAWKDVTSAHLQWAMDYPINHRWALEAGLGFASSVSGEVRDSDYDLDDRQGEFSRTYSSTHGSTFFDANLGARLTVVAPQAHGFELGLRAGVALHHQSLRIGRTRQAISRDSTRYPDWEGAEEGTSFDADSTYKARWLGPYLGVEMGTDLGRGITLSGAYTLERLRLHGRGHWALRTDMDGFDQTGWGTGQAADIELSMPLDGGARLTAGLSHRDVDVDGGLDDKRGTGPAGVGHAIDLTELRWRSDTLYLDYTLPF